MRYVINTISGGIGAFLAYILGGWNIGLQTLLIFIALDYVTGILKAIYNKKLNSTVGAKGIVKKVGYLIIVAISVMLDKVAGNTGAICNLVIYFFIANEGISILENWVSMGLPIPKKVFDLLEQIKGGENNDK